MQVVPSEVIEDLVPFTIDDLRRSVIDLKSQVTNLRKGFFSRYDAWKKENEILRNENKYLREEVELLKGAKLFMVQESKIVEFKLDAS